MKTRTGLGHKLWRAFVIQAGLISLAAVLSIYSARFVLGDVLINRALIDEAAHFWKNHRQNPDFPRPNTHNLQGYLRGMDELPATIAALEPGTHKLMKENVGYYIVYVTEQDGKRLYLEFDGESVDQLVMLFGIIPLAGVLIIIYLTTWLVYRFSRRAVSPIIQLTRQLDNLDPKNTADFVIDVESTGKEVDQEVRVLSHAISELLQRIQAFVLRERNFTRDASHELRSPLTVIKIAADVLLSDVNLDDTARKPVERIQRSARDMEELMEALLLLARESDQALSLEPVCINDILTEEVDRARMVFNDKKLQVEMDEQVRLVVPASDKVLSVLTGNLIRNAFSYTDKGRVRITVQSSALIIEDSGTGMPDHEVREVFKPFFRGGNKPRGGYGVGLTIVKMLSDRFNWPVTIESRLGAGTRVTVNFPKAQPILPQDSPA